MHVPDWARDPSEPISPSEPENDTTMRRLAPTLLATPSLIALASTMTAPAGLSAQSPVTATAEVNFLSQYFFAGIPFAAEQVSQGRLSAATGGFTVNAFGVYDYDRSEVTELDVYGDYYAQVAPTVGVFVGAALYNFDFVTQWESTPEVYAGVVLSAPLSPTVTVAHDFDLGDGTHATLTLSESVALGTTGATAYFAGNVDYNDDYYTVDFSGLSYANVGVSIGIPAGPLTVSPSLLLQFALDEDFQAQASLDDVETVFGVAASATF